MHRDIHPWVRKETKEESTGFRTVEVRKPTSAEDPRLRALLWPFEQTLFLTVTLPLPQPAVHKRDDRSYRAHKRMEHPEGTLCGHSPHTVEMPWGPVAPSLILSGRGETQETLALPTIWHCSQQSDVGSSSHYKQTSGGRKCDTHSKHYPALKRGGTPQFAATQMSLEDTMLS